MKLVSLRAAICLMLVGCGRGPANENEAREVANERFSKVVSNFHLVVADYEGPIPTSVGGAAFAFDWRKKGKKDDGVLITVTA